jgi:hypothetical protein
VNAPQQICRGLLLTEEPRHGEPPFGVGAYFQRGARKDVCVLTQGRGSSRMFCKTEVKRGKELRRPRRARLSFWRSRVSVCSLFSFESNFFFKSQKENSHLSRRRRTSTRIVPRRADSRTVDRHQQYPVVYCSGALRELLDENLCNRQGLIKDGVRGPSALRPTP